MLWVTKNYDWGHWQQLSKSTQRKYQSFLVLSNFPWSLFFWKNLLSNVVCKNNFLLINHSILLHSPFDELQSFSQAFNTNINQVRGKKLLNLKTFFSHAWFRYKIGLRKLSTFITGSIFDRILCFEPIEGNFRKFRWSSKIRGVKKVQSWLKILGKKEILGKS